MNRRMFRTVLSPKPILGSLLLHSMPGDTSRLNRPGNRFGANELTRSCRLPP